MVSVYSRRGARAELNKSTFAWQDRDNGALEVDATQARGCFECDLNSQCSRGRTCRRAVVAGGVNQSAELGLLFASR